MVRVEREVEIGRRRRGWKERWRYGGDGKDGKRGGGGDIWGPGAAGLEFACARVRARAPAAWVWAIKQLLVWAIEQLFRCGLLRGLACVRVRARACVRACMRLCVCVCMCV